MPMIGDDDTNDTDDAYMQEVGPPALSRGALDLQGITRHGLSAHVPSRHSPWLFLLLLLFLLTLLIIRS
jgi:hypothetical protein